MQLCTSWDLLLSPLGFYRGLQWHRRSGRTCPAARQHWDSVRVSGSNTASMFDLPWLPLAPTSHVSHQTPLVFLGAFALRALSAVRPRSRKFKRSRDSNTGGRAAAEKCRKYWREECSCVHPLAQGFASKHQGAAEGQGQFTETRAEFGLSLSSQPPRA